MYAMICYRTPSMFFGTLFGNFGLEMRAFLFKTVLRYCKFNGNIIRILMYRYFLHSWFRPAADFNDIRRFTWRELAVKKIHEAMSPFHIAQEKSVVWVVSFRVLGL